MAAKPLYRLRLSRNVLSEARQQDVRAGARKGGAGAHPLLRPAALRRYPDVCDACQWGQVKTVNEMLGHASANMTLNVYSHVIGNMKQEAVDRMGEVLGPEV